MARRKGLHFYRKKKKISSSLVRESISWIFGIVLAIFLAGVSNYFLGMSTNVVGDSMEPGLVSSQTVLINRFKYVLSSPKRGDVVVFLPNGNQMSHHYVKRIVALPGDAVRIEGGSLYVNGLESKWCREEIAEAGIADHEIIIANGEYFCIGDRPEGSEDSRSANIGPVRLENIVGEAWFKFSCGENKAGFIK